MKRMTFGLCALMVCFLLSSCDLLGISQSPAKKIEKVAKDISEHGEEWTVDEWVDAQRTVVEAVVDFGNSDPDQKDYDEFSDALTSWMEALNELDSSDKINKIVSRISKANEKLRKEFKNDKDFISVDKIYKNLPPKTMDKDLETPCMVIAGCETNGKKHKIKADLTTCHDTHSFLNYVLFFINTKVFRGDELREVLPEVLKNKNIISILKNHTIKNPEKVGKPFETRKHNGFTEISCKL